MTLVSPSRLWLLVLVAGLAVLYLWLGRRRRHRAVRFTNLALLQSVAPRRPGWRRHVPAALTALAMSALILGLAGPPGPGAQGGGHRHAGAGHVDVDAGARRVPLPL
jgi:Ca-activated chloride channel family protein